MSRYTNLALDLSLRGLLSRTNGEELKKLLALATEGSVKVTRKAEMIEALANHLLGRDLCEIWERLEPLEKSAVPEAAHGDGGTFDRRAFGAISAWLFQSIRSEHSARRSTVSGSECRKFEFSMPPCSP